jgi:hypothetical protein
VPVAAVRNDASVGGLDEIASDRADGDDDEASVGVGDDDVGDDGAFGADAGESDDDAADGPFGAAAVAFAGVGGGVVVGTAFGVGIGFVVTTAAHSFVG